MVVVIVYPYGDGGAVLGLVTGEDVVGGLGGRNRGVALVIHQILNLADVLLEGAPPPGVLTLIDQLLQKLPPHLLAGLAGIGVVAGFLVGGEGLYAPPEA